MNLQIRILLIQVILLGLIGCNPPLVTDGNTDINSSETVRATPSAFVEDINSSLPTPPLPMVPAISTTEPIVSISPPASIQATFSSTPTLEVTPTAKVATLTGNLWINSFDDGLVSVSVEMGEIKEVVPKAQDWLLERFAVSPDNQRVAYWIHTAEKSELWLSDLLNWNPELILTVPDLEHNAGNLWWVSNDYLLLEPAEYTHPFYLPVHAYIINLNSKQVEVESRSFGFGCLLARSPQTSDIVTWCPANEDWQDAESFWRVTPRYYVVIEEGGFLWTTEDPPQEILAELNTNQDNWGWSSDRNKVAFPLYDNVEKRDFLYIIQNDMISPVRLRDSASWYSYFRNSGPWSPNNRYLAYIGDCSGQECYRIMDVESQEVVWTSQMIPGAEHLRSVTWSEDSEYIALLTDEGLFIVHLETNEVVQQLAVPSGYVLAWLP